VRFLAWWMLQALLLGLGVVSLAWNAVALLLYPVLPRATGRHWGRAVISGAYRGFWWCARHSGLMRMDATALDALADEPGLVVVANHPSLLDALMLVARLPRSGCIMKASLVRNPFLGPGARLARYIRNDSHAGMIRLAVADLQEGGQIVMFPAGTRGTPTTLLPFRPGFALIATRACAPIQTVIIETDSSYLGKGWPLWRLPPLPIEFRVRLGRRFAPVGPAAALAAEVEAYFHATLAATPAPAPDEPFAA